MTRPAGGGGTGQPVPSLFPGPGAPPLALTWSLLSLRGRWGLIVGEGCGGWVCGSHVSDDDTAGCQGRGTSLPCFWWGGAAGNWASEFFPPPPLEARRGGEILDCTRLLIYRGPLLVGEVPLNPRPFRAGGPPPTLGWTSLVCAVASLRPTSLKLSKTERLISQPWIAGILGYPARPLRWTPWSVL